MSSLRFFVLGIAVALSPVRVPAASAMGPSFQPPNPDELKMTSEPKAPGAPAIILFRQVDRDDRGMTAHEDVYMRIKVFTEEGRKYADIEIPFDKQVGDVINVHGRTVHPDGSVVNFSGKVFEKNIVKGKSIHYLAKTFTLPDVQVGSILEYYYTTDLSEHYVFDSHWIINEELFTKSAKFSLNPYEGDNPPMYLRWTGKLPTGAVQPTQAPNKVISLQVSDVAAFQVEDYMPPENEMKSRVDFIYSIDAFEREPDQYWKKLGKKLNGQLEGFVGKRKAMEDALTQIVSPSDSPTVKLHKIYDRVQQIRNTSYEVEKTEQEQKREKEKPAANVEEVWKKQYGNGLQLTVLFRALARAAGIDASGLWVDDLQNYFFTPGSMDGRRLDANVVVAKLDGKDMFFDPGAMFIPFGMLPWYETGVKGIKMDKDGGSWVDTPLPNGTDSAITRKADLKLTETGDLEGNLTVTYTGLESWQARVQERLADDTERKKFLEDEVKSSIPVGADIDLTNKPDWKSSTSLVAEFTLKVQGWVSGAGRKALLPVGLFSAQEKHMFDHTDRVLPVYFEFPYSRTDDISIALPLGWQAITLPKAQNLDAKAIAYTLKPEHQKGALHLSRTFSGDIMLVMPTNYGILRNIFQIARNSDEQQVVLQPGT